MEIRDYLRVLQRQWFLICTVTLLGLLVAGAASILTKPIFTAETQLFVAIQNSGSVQELQQGNTFSQARVQSYVKTVATPVVLQPAIDSLGLATTSDELARKVKATNDAETVLISITASDQSAVRAASIAKAVGESLIKAVDELEKPKAGGTSPVTLSTIKPAVAPLTQTAPRVGLNLAVGLIAGLALGIAVSFLRSSMDSRIRGESDLRLITDAPLLGGISYNPDAVRKPLLTQASAQSPRAESYRQLRTNLQFANVTGTAKTVLVTSSLPGEGKSTTATNLAIALAQAGQHVCLVDADLRRPSVHEYLGLDRNAGLTTALMGRADLSELLQPWGFDHMHVLTSGQIPPNPSELLGSDRMLLLLQELEGLFDTVIIDAPPVLPVTDAAVLSQHVGGVVVVVGSQRLRQQQLEKSLETLRMVGSTLLGVVLNRLPNKGPDAYSYEYYGHEDSADVPMQDTKAKKKTREAHI